MVDKVSIHSIPPPIVQYNTTCLKQPTNPSEYHDALVFGKIRNIGFLGRIKGVFSWVWETMKSLFEKIFYCPTYSGGVFGKSHLEKLLDLKSETDNARKEFVSKRGELEEVEFKQWWQSKFDGLSEELRMHIVKADIRCWPQNDGKGASIDNLEQWVDEKYGSSSDREKACRYVRNLERFSNDRYSWNPMDDSQVPAFLEMISKRLASQVEDEKVE